MSKNIKKKYTNISKKYCFFLILQKVVVKYNKIFLKIQKY